VQTTTGEQSALLTSDQMSTMMVRGRDVVSLLKILPGISWQADQVALGGAFGTNTTATADAPANFNQLNLDGVLSNDLGTPNVFSSSVSMDAVEEVKALLNAYKTEYAGNGGAVISVVTKSNKGVNSMEQLYSCTRRYALGLAIFALILLAGGPVCAQIFTGMISGTVSDPSGASVPEAALTLTAVKRGLELKASTDANGRFVFPSLEPGEYTLTVGKSGFNTVEQKNIPLQAGERLALGTITLALGGVTQVVSVTAEAAFVKTESSERSGNVSSTQIASLLVIGRSLPSLVGLLPGVVMTGETDSITRSGNFTSQGARVNTNNISVDGIQSTDIDNANDLKLQVSQDAVAEMQVLLTNYQAEYGSGSGAVVNMVTKSGTKEFHGLGSYFTKNEFFDANNFFNNRTSVRRPRARTNTWTYNIGGPAYLGKWNRNRDKLFFFWNQEFWPTKGSATVNLTVPTALERTGDFSKSLYQNGTLVPVYDPFNNGAQFPGNVVPASRIDSNGQALLKLFPAANFFDRTISQGAYNYVYTAPADTPNRLETLKMDYNINSNNQLYGTYSTFHEVSQGYVFRGYFVGNWPLVPLRFMAASKGATGRYTRTISPTTINEIKFSWMGNPESLEINSAEALARSLRKNIGFTAGQLAPEANPEGIIPSATFGGVPSAADLKIQGRYRLPRMFDPNNLYTVTENFTMIRQGHTFKGGVQVQRFWRGIGPEDTRFGSFDFGVNSLNPLNTNYAYANAVLGVYNSYTETTADPYYWSRGGRIDWFVQDTWKVASRLTLDYGMRFYYLNVAYDKNDGWAGFDPARFDAAKNVQLIRPGLNSQGKRIGVHPVTGQQYSEAAIGAMAPGSGVAFNGMVSPSLDSAMRRGMYENRGVQFGPRFGFSWDAFGKGKTAIRGGFGMFYNPLAISAWRAYTAQPPLVQQPVLQFGQISTLLSTTGLLFPSSVRGINAEGKVPTTMNYSLSVQQNVGFATVLDVAYVGSLGRHLSWVRNLNSIPFGTNFNPANLDPTTGRALTSNLLRPIKGYSDVLFMETAGSSNYHSLQASANRRFTRGLQFGVSWTWSKAMEFAGGDTTAVSVLVPIRVWNYGPSGNDRTHVLRVNWLWAVPKTPWRHVAAKAVLGDWQVSGIASFISGAPVGVGFSTQPAVDITGSPSDGARANLLGNPVLPKSERTFSHNFKTEMAALPAIGTYGNSSRTPLRGPGVNNWDFAIFKSFATIRERIQTQLRWELYNAFNHTQFSAFNSSAIFNSSGQQVNPTFGQYTAARAARRMQLALRLTF